MHPPIRTARLTLRKPERDDLTGYLAYRNAAETSADDMPPLDEAAAQAFLQAQADLADDATGWRMFALDRHDRRGIIGEVGLFVAPEDSRTADLGWWLHPDHRGRGYATEAAEALVSWCFATRALHRVTAHCLAGNAASVAIMARIGMRPESRTVESRWLGERWHDEVGYALLRREWTARRTASAG